MLIYGGIDEAGYGPMFGPLTVGSTLFSINNPSPSVGEGGPSRSEGPGEEEPSAREESANQPLQPQQQISPPCLWKLLRKAVCKNLTSRRGRIPINDSKALYSPSTGLQHLET